MKIVKWLDKNIEAVICVLLLCIMSTVLFIQVIMRHFFNNSLVWSEELARYIFIWLIYLSISYAAKELRHIKIEEALALFPRFLRPYITILGHVLFLAYAIIIINTGWELVRRQQMLRATSPAMLIPMWIVYLAPVVGFIFTGVREIQLIIKGILDLKKGPSDRDTGNLEIEGGVE